ncbi:MAG: RNase adapter RapZ [Deltaproteobacteria bacterium]|nr:RNase adapter RapZ [Deltaproteobacteria bacterium]MBV8450688.1 RNase adapter RapZ [Deltaproteobacteria bacterium]
MAISDEIDARRFHLYIVTGVSGSGRGSAMRVLEDLGYYCVDNLPVVLARSVVGLAREHDPKIAGVALGIDARERLFFPQWPQAFAELERAGFKPEVIFLNASDEVLARRYSESRRPHPLAQSGMSVVESIRRERLALAEMRERATLIIDTSTTTIHELRELLTAAVIGAKTGDRMTIALVSFGYKYGHPLGLDLILDVRFIPNPFFVPSLRDLSGTDPRVHDYVMAHPDARRFIREVTRLLKFLVPLYRREGKSYLTIGLGCTGGRHRSPVLARELRDVLIHEEIEAEVRDHDLAREDR